MGSTTIGVIVILVVAVILIGVLIWASRQNRGGHDNEPITFMWNIYPDIIFPNNCAVHAEYSVSGGSEDDDIGLVIVNPDTNEQIAVWNGGREFNGGFEGTSLMLNNGAPGIYFLRLIRNQKIIPFAEHAIIILKTPSDMVNHVVSSQYPDDLIETNVFNIKQKITNMRIKLPDEPVKAGKATPFVLCTKYISIKSVRLVSATDWEEGDSIDIKIGGSYFGKLHSLQEKLVIDNPIILENEMNIEISHLHGADSVGLARNFSQGDTYEYKFIYEFVQ